MLNVATSVNFTEKIISYFGFIFVKLRCFYDQQMVLVLLSLLLILIVYDLYIMYFVQCV